MTTIKAHYDGKAFIPDEPVDCPVDEPLMLHVDQGILPEKSITGAELAKSGLIGLWKHRTDIGDSLAYARRLRVQAETRERSEP